MTLKDFIANYIQVEIGQPDIEVFTIDNVMLDQIETNKIMDKDENIYSVFPLSRTSIGIRLEKKYKDLFEE